MFSSKKRARRGATVLGAVIGLMIIFTFVIGLLNPSIGTRDTESDLPEFTPFGTLPPPTKVIVPTPEANPQLEGELPYIHSSGYFQTFKPAGIDWTVNDIPATQDSIRLSVIIQSSPRLVVIHNYLQQGVEYDSLDSLSQNYLTADYFASEWSRYESWEETGRQVGETSVTVNFNLNAEDINYLGRDVTRLEGSSVYVTRLIVPANNPGLLDQITGLVAAQFKGYPELQPLPREWNTYADQQLGFTLKYPSGWRLAAGNKGRPVVFRTLSGIPDSMIRIRVLPNQPLISEEEASAWVTQDEPSAEIGGTAPVQHTYGSGYQVAFTFADESGDRHSALAVLLNDSAGTLFVAILQLESAGANLLDPGTLALVDAEARQAVVDGFVVLPPDARQAAAPAVDTTITESAPDATPAS